MKKKNDILKFSKTYYFLLKEKEFVQKLAKIDTNINLQMPLYIFFFCFKVGNFQPKDFFIRLELTLSEKTIKNKYLI